MLNKKGSRTETSQFGLCLLYLLVPTKPKILVISPRNSARISLVSVNSITNTEWNGEESMPRSIRHEVDVLAKTSPCHTPVKVTSLTYWEFDHGRCLQ